jgi:hypothetical protein
LPKPSEDNDGDGLSLWEEYLWTTDPTDSSSRSRLILEAESQGGWKLRLSPFHENRIYRVQARRDFTESQWLDLYLANPTVDENGWGVFRIPAAFPFRFFRILVNEI